MMGVTCFILGLLIVSLCLVLETVQACSGRVYLNATYGVITDGVGDYKEASHCEWLIEAPNNARYITLEFVSMETECAYDYLFIYDGNSYSSPLLGSFSGGTLPDKVLASSGHMLIYFFSDRNYVRIGFHANFSTTECPHNCSGHGACNTAVHRCSCWQGFMGEACERQLCPAECSSHGECNVTRGGCVCEAGYLGSDCGLPVHTLSEVGGWTTVLPAGSGFTPRTGHASVFLPDKGCLYIFGGSNLNDLLDELLRYCVHTNKWENVQTVDGRVPAGRHGHAMVGFNSLLYMYGGILVGGNHSDELWRFDVKLSRWSLMEVTGSVLPPGLASHTLTAVDNTWLYLFGGQKRDEEFVSEMYRINMLTPNKWQEVISIGGKQLNRRLSGHSAVYHPQSRSIFVFGGFTPDYARFPKRTNLLHAFHVDQNHWSQINYGLSEAQDPPLERAFHSASIVGNYMIIVGGNAHIHHRAELCFDGDVYYYHLGCHRWILRETLEKPFLGTKQSSNAPKGRFSHTANVLYGNTILVSGGYRGNVLGDLLAYTIPESVAQSESAARLLDPCNLLTSYSVCVLDPECIWCTKTMRNKSPKCIHRSKAKKNACVGAVHSGYCPGICAALHDCASCTIHGHASAVQNQTSELWNQHQCVWCVKEQQCQSTTELQGACNASDGTLSGVAAWWGEKSSQLTSVDQCRLQDMPAGLHLIKYRYPPNFTNPDEVDIIHESRVKIQFSNVCEAEGALGGENTLDFRGFLHPLGTEPHRDAPNLQVYLEMAGGQGWLNISTDDAIDNQEEVAALNAATFQSKVASRGDGTAIFPHEERGHKYYMVERGAQRIAESTVIFYMRAEWTAKVHNSEQFSQPFTSEFLEPYNSYLCDEYSSCLACMTDTGCGWCPTSATCVQRAATTLSERYCGVVDGAQRLVFNQSDCIVCSDHLNCHTCTGDSLCEWLTSEARCMRRGRFPQALTDPASCPVPCSTRTNCSWCIADENECAWCEQTNTCFPFMGYILRHNYGGCTNWVDSMSTQRCHDCTQHRACKDCMEEYQCGWCGNTDNPTIGRCLHGDFTGPDLEMNCSAAISEVKNISHTEASDWSYGICPDVEECRLGYHDCHENATCVNTFSHYECHCNRGFQGDGKLACDRTCYYDCIHGDCSGTPDYQCVCDVGWMGEECDINCQCNNHSYCERGIGVCDQCMHHTTGEYCELCSIGSYGDATSPTGCLPCPCNGHADPVRGLCNKTTGECYCVDNTEGDQCERCKDGYYGNPRNNSKCYLRCEGRMVLGNVTSGYLGSQAGNGVSRPSHGYCLWILTIYENINNLRLLDIMPTITFTMETDIKTKCGRDYVYVFDGIPDFASSDPKNWAPLLAAYCGYGLMSPLSVEATSGYLSVYYEANMESSSHTRGFNASYHINNCPNNCNGERVCHGNHCDCLEGYSGVDCQTEICPGECSEGQGHGKCDMNLGYCDCHYGYGGLSCSAAVATDSATYLPINDPWRRGGIEAFGSSKAHMGHSLVSCDDHNLLMYGGVSFSHEHPEAGVVWKYNINSDAWDLITPVSSDRPLNRYFHSAVCLPSLHAMFVFGGLITNQTGQVSATSQVWKFSLDSYRWTKLETPATSEGAVPAMAGHTMTVIEPTKAIIIGGFSTTNYFADANYQFDAAKFKWTKLGFKGVQPTGIYGHTSIFHHNSNTVYVYGGYEYQTDKMAISSNLYALDLRKERWSILPPSYGNKPRERSLHTAVNMDDYMVVIGGATSDADFDGSVWAYRYTCNHWINVSAGLPGVHGNGNTAVRGAAAYRTINHDIYHIGGFNGLMHPTVTKIHLPSDLCNLNPDPQRCTMLGCDLCSVKETNETYCYDNSRSRPQGCLLQNTTITIQKGISCDKDLVTGRACSHHKSCSECLARWPAHEDHDDVCKWCSNCPTGICVRHEADCERANPCQRQQRVISGASNCVEHLCQAADCDKCWRLGRCIWTRQFKRSSEVGRTLSLVPIYDWNCVSDTLVNATTYEIQAIPPSTCPKRCHQHATCSACLSSLGAEGGAQECYWSVTARECFPPAYLPLRCASGSCGHIQSGSPSQCPRPCNMYTQCAGCQATPGCGWCALGGMNGLGVCMEGSLMVPHHGACVLGNITQGSGILSDSQKLWLSQSVEAPVWAFDKCPPENECQNGHHTCQRSEDCTDLQHGYRCDCKPGYRRDNKTGHCKPHCRDGCEPHGTCVEPDVCQCHFGYIGHNCTMECLCNKHSDCHSVQYRNVCLACHNNTRGDQCSMCNPLYVGNPIDGGECRSCLEVCNQHTSVCLSQEDLNRTMIFRALPLDPHNVTRWVHSGSKSENKAVCMHCQNNTMGAHCEDCQTGFFRLTSQPITDPCQLCQCQGHSDLCNKKTGTDCDCKNNTQSPRCDTSLPEKNCHLKQCSECMESFLGTPTLGHQCYRQMTVDHDYCLDPVTQSDCFREPAPLLKGRTVFYAVQPKYLNVDIRVTLDITAGGVNVYLANLENAFQVSVDKKTGQHKVHMDPQIFPADLDEIMKLGRSRRSAPFLLSRESLQSGRRRRRATDQEEDDSSRKDDEYGAGNATEADVIYQMKVVEAKGINTFIMLENSTAILAVKTLENRLVITLPSHVHELKKTRFYIILHGVGSMHSNDSSGLIFFRQDQPHIDLFVFFSVFFSSFFLFLDLCVLVWKIKQAAEARRSRQRRRVEMQCMASRPFGKALVAVPEDEQWSTSENHTLPPSRKSSHHRLTMTKFASKYSLGATNMAFARNQTDDPIHVNPLALEPTDDGVAAVGTFFFELPGGQTAPIKACLGSTLLTMRVMYPNQQHSTTTYPAKTHHCTGRCPNGTL